MKHMQCKCWWHQFFVKEISSEKLVKLFDEYLQATQLTIMKFSECYVPGGVYIATWILAESHFMIRVRPSDNKASCDLSCCNLKKFHKFLQIVAPEMQSIAWHEWHDQSIIKETNPDKINKSFDGYLKKAKLAVVAFEDCHFPGDGYTAIWMLEKGNFIVVHTFPEDGKTDVECSFNTADLDPFCGFLTFINSQ
ncbi:MAG TPA: hypothetical protein VJH89_02450 [Patescibacteria group bacterium]|nr:hypothetical protein [Patescibacteria group bacterium]